MYSDSEFLKILWKYHKAHRRDLPWRNTHDPYRILVSEMMLQQTQVSRVLIKYKEFLKAFPTLKALAKAPITDVLKLWKGLGYNRRAFFLKRIADEVAVVHAGKFPKQYTEMLKLPGIGQSTAGAISVFSFNQKIAFLETNIRAVYMYFFFKKKISVTDAEIRAKLEETLSQIPTAKVREFYYTLYDYGSMLKSKLGKERQKLHAQHKGYKTQSSFIGSNRQLRAIILQYMVEVHPRPVTFQQISKHISQLIKDRKIRFEDSAETKKLTKVLVSHMQKEKQISYDTKKKVWAIITG